MKIIILILLIIGCGLVAIGFFLLGTVQRRHAIRNGGAYRSLLIKPTEADIKMLRIGSILAFLGILIVVIIAVAGRIIIGSIAHAQ